MTNHNVYKHDNGNIIIADTDCNFQMVITSDNSITVSPIAEGTIADVIAVYDTTPELTKVTVPEADQFTTCLEYIPIKTAAIVNLLQTL